MQINSNGTLTINGTIPTFKPIEHNGVHKPLVNSSIKKSGDMTLNINRKES